MTAFNFDPSAASARKQDRGVFRGVWCVVRRFFSPKVDTKSTALPSCWPNLVHTRSAIFEGQIRAGMPVRHCPRSGGPHQKRAQKNNRRLARLTRLTLVMAGIMLATLLCPLSAGDRILLERPQLVPSSKVRDGYSPTFLPAQSSWLYPCLLLWLATMTKMTPAAARKDFGAR